MNPFEQQMKLAREMMELNADWFRKLAEFDSQNFNNYVEFNRDFASRLPEVKDVQSFVELQREYGEQLWNNTQQALKTRAEMQREAFAANNEILRKAFSPRTQEDPAEEKPVEEKPSTKQASATKPSSTEEAS